MSDGRQDFVEKFYDRGRSVQMGVMRCVNRLPIMGIKLSRNHAGDISSITKKDYQALPWELYQSKINNNIKYLIDNLDIPFLSIKTAKSLILLYQISRENAPH